MDETAPGNGSSLQAQAQADAKTLITRDINVHRVVTERTQPVPRRVQALCTAAGG